MSLERAMRYVWIPAGPTAYYLGHELQWVADFPSWEEPLTEFHLVGIQAAARRLRPGDVLEIRL